MKIRIEFEFDDNSFYGTTFKTIDDAIRFLEKEQELMWVEGNEDSNHNKL